MTTVVISQPQYFPWPGFFDLVAKADIYVHLDDVQFSKGSFTNRIQTKQPSGIKWMTIPLAGKGSHQTIADLQDDGSDWRGHHRRLLHESLKDAPHVATALDLFGAVTARESLAEVLAASVERTARHLGVAPQTRFETASRLRIAGKSWRRVLDIVLALGGTRYVTAHGAANYLDHEAFEREGVSVAYIDYKIRPWVQAHGPFTPYVTTLDLVAHTGANAVTHLDSGLVPWREHMARLEAAAADPTD